ncbi:MAG: hypothetical protein M1838_005989 [Thelocarpon superellum]|nr:MAG: hypothetical protein M1838_005989 [Thelocarpon superellum]
MRASLAAASWLTLCATATVATDSTDPQYAAFIAPISDEMSALPAANVSKAEIGPMELGKRQFNCPSGYASCAGLGGANAGQQNTCCQPGTNCQLDQNRNVACCPNGQQCNADLAQNGYNGFNGYNGLTTFVTNGVLVTSQIGGYNGFNGLETCTSNGIIITAINGQGCYGYNGNGYNGLTTYTSNGIVVTGYNGNGYNGYNGYNGFLGASVTTYTSNGVLLTTTFANTGAGPTTEASSITNSYFTYPALPTTFPNAAVCSAAYADCQTDYQKCTAQLGGGGNGATITLPGGNQVQVGATVTLGPTATSICSSLSQSACRGLALSNCNTYGVNGVSGNMAMPTGVAPMYGVGVGVALGVAGNLMG